DHHLVARAAAEQLVERHAGDLGLDVPQRHVDGGDGGHGDGAAAPVGALVEVLPDVLGAERVLADEGGGDVILQVGDDREPTAVRRAGADAVHALAGHRLHGGEVAPGRADDALDLGDLHTWLFRATPS